MSWKHYDAGQTFQSSSASMLLQQILRGPLQPRRKTKSCEPDRHTTTFRKITSRPSFKRSAYQPKHQELIGRGRKRIKENDKGKEREEEAVVKNFTTPECPEMCGRWTNNPAIRVIIFFSRQYSLLRQSTRGHNGNTGQRRKLNMTNVCLDNS